MLGRQMTMAAPSVDVLVAKYALSARKHPRALARGRVALSNRHADRIAAIYRELRTRGPEAQAALLDLLDHDDPSVRGWAAAHGLEIDAARAEPVLREVAAGGGVVGFAATMTLREWQAGRLHFP